MRRIDQAGAGGGALVSVMSVWEVSLLHAKRRLSFDRELRTWVRQALAPPIRVVDLTPEIAVECHHLPPWPHNDPADRILVATVRQEGLTLLTRDRAILDYAAKGHVRALAC
jgi:PIN domain nuclease of toxin-antitoxin system